MALVLVAGLGCLALAAWLVLRDEPAAPPKPEPLLFLARPGCPRDEMLAAYVDGALDARQAALLTLHFPVCPGCRDRSLALIHRAAEQRRPPRRGPAALVALLVLMLAPPFGGDPPRSGAGCSTWRVLVHGARADVLPDAPHGARADVPPMPKGCTWPSEGLGEADRWRCVTGVYDRGCALGDAESCERVAQLRRGEAAARLRYAAEHAAWEAEHARAAPAPSAAPRPQACAASPLPRLCTVLSQPLLFAWLAISAVLIWLGGVGIWLATKARRGSRR